MTPPRVAILTPDPEDRDFHSRWRSVLERIRAPLIKAGIDIEALSWAGRPELGRFDLVLPLLVWGYHRSLGKWRQSVAEWESQGVRLLNPATILGWNADKYYLGQLAEAGAPVTPTLFVDRIDEDELEEAARRFGCDRLVAKPVVSASAWQTLCWTPGSSLEGGPEAQAMIQPFLPAILEEGEVSLFFLDGEFSHSVRKRPQPGDFRVQPEYDGIITPHQPSADELEASGRILAEVKEPLLYARVDLVRDSGGLPLLMELELIEPDLYLEQDPGAGAAFAAVVLRAAGR